MFLGLLFTALCGLACARTLEITDFAEPDAEDDLRPALAKAFAELKKGDTLFFPPGEYVIRLTKGRLQVPAGVRLLGSGPDSVLRLQSNGGGKDYRAFLSFASGSGLQNLRIERAAKFPLVMFPLFGEVSGIFFRGCVIDGRNEEFAGTYCHVFQVGSGRLEGLEIIDSTVRRASYGLFQANEATGVVKGVRVERCLFEKNSSSDLEFNSPRGQMSEILVRDCLFRENRCPSPSAGFAVGF
ncbi:MAG: hypothetical protein ACQKBY_08465, partial [Verrucomicrobiales bacterium]